MQLSGLVASRRQAGIFYGHRDAGAPAVLYVFDESGADLGRVALEGLATRDWEDIAATGTDASGASRLFVGDIGDNAARTGGNARADLQIYRVAEPDAPSGGATIATSEWERIVVAYPSEAHDAETLMYDPIDDLLVIVTKDLSGMSKVYSVPASTAAEASMVLDLVTEIEIGLAGTQAAQASAGDISPSGDRILVRNYENALLWTREPGESLAAAFAREPTLLEAAPEPQSEGATFSFDGTAWYSAGEQVSSFYRAGATCD